MKARHDTKYRANGLDTSFVGPFIELNDGVEMRDLEFCLLSTSSQWPSAQDKS
jgi:hypothetical protein